ncbi:MAG: hypothetical protein ACRECL_18830 [Bradyrhizobium sp.]
MISLEAAGAWASGAAGIACDAVMAIRPRPKAKAEAASSFIGDVLFPWITVIRLFSQPSVDGGG